ncbi:MAG: DUF2155 domain-containing protein [Alphaproteobacteria bacterium]|nr:DUF2155 domain-containing protein [Alphaproteobacteria bacterium]
MKNKLFGAFAFMCLFLCAFYAFAEDIDTNMGQFQAMDKITGRVNIIEVPVGGMVQFGSFSVVLRTCKTHSAEEVPENFAFVDIADKSFGGEEYNIFKGWMFSSSPAVNAVEHPIYDVWLLKCFNGDLKGKTLLSEQELNQRDNLPRLNEVVTLNESLKQNTFIADDVQNISFKDEMYKQDVLPQEKNRLPEKSDGEPQNLLMIDEDYVAQEEMLAVEPEEFSKALAQEASKLESENTDIEKLENQIEIMMDDSLVDEIDAELQKAAQ